MTYKVYQLSVMLLQIIMEYILPSCMIPFRMPFRNSIVQFNQSPIRFHICSIALAYPETGAYGNP